MRRKCERMSRRREDHRRPIFRPVTQDGLPLIGRVPQIEGVYVATGHNVWGILNAFFHFGDGMAVRNLCRERLSDDELAACCPVGGDWDNCYIGVLAAIAAMRQ